MIMFQHVRLKIMIDTALIYKLDSLTWKVSTNILKQIKSSIKNKKGEGMFFKNCVAERQTKKNIFVITYS